MTANELDQLQPGDTIRYNHRGHHNHWATVATINERTITTETTPHAAHPHVAKDRVLETRKAGA